MLMLYEMDCFPPTHRVCCSPVRLCHSRCCARTSVFGLIRSITGKQQTTQGPSIRTGIPVPEWECAVEESMQEEVLLREGACGQSRNVNGG